MAQKKIKKEHWVTPQMVLDLCMKVYWLLPAKLDKSLISVADGYIQGSTWNHLGSIFVCHFSSFKNQNKGKNKNKSLGKLVHKEEKLDLDLRPKSLTTKREF